MLLLVLSFLAAVFLLFLTWATWICAIKPAFNPLRIIPGPPVRGLFGSHMGPLLDPVRSPKTHEIVIRDYGRHARVRGLGPWDERYFTLDPASLTHIMKHNTIYEKPWQSRRLIISLIGCGMLAAEGAVHKRQRRVATPAFSIQNLRAFIPLVFKKGVQLRDKFAWLIREDPKTPVSSETKNPLGDSSEMKKTEPKGTRLDVVVWISRATFDVIGLAGFEYDFNAIEDETNELFAAYKDMFEIAISQNQGFRAILGIYLPWANYYFPDSATKLITNCQNVIRRVAGKIIQEKKTKVADGDKAGAAYQGKDLLSLMLKSNVAVDLPPEQRLTDDDILHSINTFMFAGSDTTSLALAWTLLLLAQNPTIQSRLRSELLSILPPSSTGTSLHNLENLPEDEILSLYEAIAANPYLDNVCRESLRLVPPVHSSLRVATQDNMVPTSYPIMERTKDGKLRETGRTHVFVPKGTFVHVPVEAFNLDRHIWGEDAWKFIPDRWENLPEAVKLQPGLYQNTMTFSAGPRSCIGMRFSIVEIKAFLYILLSSFEFLETEDQIYKANVSVLTRPYVKGKFKEGSQCPLYVRPYSRTSD